MNTGYIKSLDGVRAIAILLVMTFHANITHFGWFGVQLFFVLSGFLITGILWKEKSAESTLSHKFKKFWTRRSLRIFPLYFGYLFFLGLTYVFFHFPSYYETYIPYLATYTFNYTRTLLQWQGNPLFTHLWSLSIEEQFYLFFPLIIFFGPPRFIKALMLAGIAFAPLIRFALGKYYQSKGLPSEVVADAVYWNTLSHLDAFFMGGIIPVLSLHTKIKKPHKIFFISLLIAIFAGIINFIYTPSSNNYFSDLGYNHGLTANYEHVWHYTVLNILFASFILFLVSDHTQKKFISLRRIFESKILVRIGKVSYGMYIFHWAILVYVFEHFFQPQNMLVRILLFIPYTILVYLFAVLSYRLYESKFIKLKDQLFKTKAKKSVTAIKPASNYISVIKENR
ncbi:MAG: acyltransferase family protein [Chitinophagaceae bacterium]